MKCAENVKSYVGLTGCSSCGLLPQYVNTLCVYVVMTLGFINMKTVTYNHCSFPRDIWQWKMFPCVSMIVFFHT